MTNKLVKIEFLEDNIRGSWKKGDIKNVKLEEAKLWEKEGVLKIIDETKGVNIKEEWEKHKASKDKLIEIKFIKDFEDLNNKGEAILKQKKGEIVKASKENAKQFIELGYAEYVDNLEKKVVKKENKCFVDKKDYERLMTQGKREDMERLFEYAVLEFEKERKREGTIKVGEEYANIVNEDIDDDEEEDNELNKEIFLLIIRKQEDSATELIVEEIEKNNKIYTTKDDIKSEIWFYKDGIYIPNGISKIKEITRKILEKAYTPQRVNKVIAKIEADTYIEVDEFFKNNYINEIPVQNGILNLITKDLIPFTLEKIFFSKLPVKYNPKSKCPNIDKFYDDVLKDPTDKEVMYEKHGNDLYKDHFIEKGTMFVGDGRNGKTKALSLRKAFVGPENCCSVPLSKMHSNSNSICELHGKLINLAGDLNSTALKETGIYKEIVGRDTIGAPRKYLRDLFFVNYSKQYFACNELPKVYDKSLGFWSKWDLFEFPYTFVSQEHYNNLSEDEKNNHKIKDPDIMEKITTDEELSGLLNKAIEGLHKILKKKDFSTTKGTNEIKNFWIRKADSFMAFCLDNIEENPETMISKKDIRKKFSKYCRRFKLKGTSDIVIKITLEDLFGVIDEFKVVPLSGTEEREYVWVGIQWKNKEKLINVQDEHTFTESHSKKNTLVYGKTMHTLHKLQNEDYLIDLEPQKPGDITDITDTHY